MTVFYHFLMMHINVLLMYLYFRILFNIDLGKRKGLAFILSATLVLGLNVNLLFLTAYRGLMNFALSILITKFFFKLNWGKTILGVGLFAIAGALGEGTANVILSILGIPIIDALNTISVSFLVNFVSFTVILSFILLYSILFKRKVYSSYDNNLAAIYVAATLFSLILYNFSFGEAVLAGRQLPAIMGGILVSLFTLSSLIFFFSTRKLAIKKEENVRLISDMQTIKRLNEQLEAEIEERKKLEEQLKFYATTDTLTGVLNRRTGILLLENAMKETKRIGQPITICFADINFLKQINDTYGHNEGDELIIAVSAVLKEALRESDSICRLGGDEFLLILHNCNKEQVKEVIERIEYRMEQYNASEQKVYKISLSFGFAECGSGCSLSIDELIEIADKEMYQMKQQARLA